MAQTIVSSPFTDNRMTLTVSHTSHGFDANDIGKAVRSSGTDGQFVVARANTAANAEVVGVITSIDTANQYTITTSGFVDVVAAVPTATAGTVFFLAEADDSQLTSTEPTTVGAVSKPVAVITESNAKMILIHYRGEVLTSTAQTNAPNDATYITLSTNSTLTSERTLAAGSGITLTDAGANGAATISIANDAIDSQHYAATSIDNEHLADNAVDSDELAAGAVDIAHLSATGTASSSTFLRGDNAWAAPGGGYDECARVYSDSTQSFANGATDAIAFNQERFDTDAIHDNSTNNTRLTCKTAGVYVISGTIQWEYDTSATHRRLGIIKYDSNGNNGTYIDFVSKDESPATGHKMTITTIYKLAVNEFVTLVARQNSGGALTTTVNANHSPEFSMARIGIG